MGLDQFYDDVSDVQEPIVLEAVEEPGLLELSTDLLHTLGHFPKELTDEQTGREPAVKLRQLEVVPDLIEEPVFSQAAELLQKRNAVTYLKEVVRQTTVDAEGKKRSRVIATMVVMATSKGEVRLAVAVVGLNDKRKPDQVKYSFGEQLALERARSSAPHKFRKAYIGDNAAHQALVDFDLIKMYLETAKTTGQAQNFVERVLNKPVRTSL